MTEWLFPRYEPVVKERVPGCVGAVGMADTQSPSRGTVHPLSGR